MRVERRGFDQLPDEIRAAVQTQVGADCRSTDMATGESSGVAALLFLADGSRVFVKGLPDGHERARELDAEARVNPFLPGYAPRLLWRLAAGGWTLLGFEGVTATPWADFTPGSGHLEPVAAVLHDLSTRTAPGLKTVWDRWGSYCEPADEALLDGRCLVHGDPVATNFLVGDRVWLVDWAWAAQGPAWADATLWGFRLVLDGHHAPEQAHERALTIPAFAAAPRRGVRVLAEAEARSWEDWQAYGTPGIDVIAKAARAWADYVNGLPERQ
ncbi:aminoglycoside phosphotransferase [Streptomyces olivoreticuli]